MAESRHVLGPLAHTALDLGFDVGPALAAYAPTKRSPSSSSSPGRAESSGPGPIRRPRARKQRYSRSRTGCLTCRSRKVKCDEDRPVCTRCRDLEIECQWPNPSFLTYKPRSRGKACEDEQGDEERIEAVSVKASSSTSVSSSEALFDRIRDSVQRRTPLSLKPLQTRGTPVAPAPTGQSRPCADPSPASTASDTDSEGSWALSMPGRGANDLPLGLFAPLIVAQSNAAVAFNPVAFLHQLARVPPPPIPQRQISMETSTLVKRRQSRLPDEPVLDMPMSTLAARDPTKLVTSSLDPLSGAFPTPASRRLFHHFFSLTSSIVIAMNCQRSTRKRNPILNISLPLLACDTDSPARTAFRLGILSLAAGHLHHQYLDSGAGVDHDACELLAETRRSRRHASAHMLLSLTRQGDAELDLLLATCMMLKTRDVVLADKGWKQNLEFALKLIVQRGGPAAHLAADPHNFARRFVLEQLATSDVFSTFTTGDEPTLLGHSAPWWLEHDRSASTEWQWDAYEHVFGVSRGMAELVAKCRVIVNRKARVLEAVATKTGVLGSSLSDAGEIDADMAAIAEAIDCEALKLIEQLGLWSMSQQGVPQHTRVLLGDSAYRYAMVIMLLHEVLGVEDTDGRVQEAVCSVLELCAEISMEPIMLVWPLLIAGARAKEDNGDRKWVRDLFGVFRKDHCTDLVTAETLLAEQWRRIDAGTAFTPWPTLMQEMDLVVLLI